LIDIIKPSIASEETTDNAGVFVIEPVERGYGHTLGNSLRRTLLSSLPGAAVTWIRIDGVPHEFSTVKGALEDVTDIILNIKQLVFKLEREEPAIVKLEIKGPKEVTAADISLPSDVEIINKDARIVSLNSKGSIKMEMQVELGSVYVSA
jgi:DNA-directed RNA polymerase subunit alpha